MKASPAAKTYRNPTKATGKLSVDDIRIAKHLNDNGLMDHAELAKKFGVTQGTIQTKLSRLNQLPESNDKSIAEDELRQIINFLITYKKRLVLTLGKVNFDDFKSFDDITKALKTLTGIFSPLHAAYRSETAKSGQVQVNLTQIIEQNWENDDERRKKIVNMLQARKDAGKQAK